MKKYITLSLITAVLLIISAFVPSWIVNSRVEVTLTTVKADEYTESVIANGSIEYDRKKEVYSDLPVIPEQVLVDIGDHVEVGDLLATVNIEDTCAAAINILNLGNSNIPAEVVSALSGYDTEVGNKKCEQRNFLSDKNPSMARAFQSAGYATGHIGKWHMGGGRDVHNAPSIKNYGFDEYISTYESPDPEPAITATNWIWSAKDSVKRWRRTEYFVNKSIDFVKRHKDQPFFLNLWPDDMHTPWVPEFKQKDNKSWNTEEAFIPVLAEMDKQIGRFIKALDELGLSENTIVIFTSDNGPAPSFQSARAAYLRGTKNSLYEGGIRMPFLIKYPKKIKAGQVNNESVLCAVDLYPSLCAIAGIETEKGYQGDGQNYDKVLLGKSKAKRKTDLMWDFGRNQFFKKPGNVNDRSPHLAIRSGNWKLLINSDGSDAQLYDIEKDKFEKNDVAQSHPQVVAKLSKKVCKWFAENKDKGKE